MWTVPLFLYASTRNSDVALLSAPPSSFLLPAIPLSLRSSRFVDSISNTSLYGTFFDDYELLTPDAIAYAHTMDGYPYPSYPLVTLRAYWSAQRNDIITTTSSITEVNTKANLDGHDGDYVLLSEIGYLNSDLNPGITAHQYVPMLISYDDVRTDTVTAPINGADINLMTNLNTFLSGATSFGAGIRTGFARRATCSFCNISMSESFPSAGGADCAYVCAPSKSCKVSKYVLGGTDDPAMVSFDKKMEEAGEILKQFGVATVTTGSSLHLSLNYFCCYSEIDLTTIESVLDSHDWPSIQISFDRPVWRIDSDATAADHYSIIVLADEPSQQRLQKLVADIEGAIRARGVDIHVTRSDQEPFHSTLGVVNGTTYPCEAAIAAVVDAIPSGSWTEEGTLTLVKPVW